MLPTDNESDYYKINETLLQLVGFWPSYSKLKYLQLTLGYICFSTVITVQLMTFATAECTLELTLRVLSTVFPSVIGFVRYHAFNIYSTQVKNLLTKVKNDWNFVRENVREDIHILHAFTNNGRTFTMALATLIASGLIGCLILYLLPCFLDFVAPLNESRIRRHLALAEYYVDQQKYFYPIFFHMMSIVVIGMLSIVAAESIFTAFLLHSCGMFEIAGCRLERAVDIDNRNKYSEICTRVAKAVQVHQRAHEVSERLWSIFGFSYFFQTSIGVISLSVNLLRFYEALIDMNHPEELIGSILFITAHLTYMTLDHFRGQLLLDCSDFIFQKAYSAEWYQSPAKAQKLFLIVMQRTIKETALDFVGVVTYSVRGFSAVVSTAVSYFTVIYSVRED